ncbi:hypothetical protein PACTADRAFT_4437 [Pachysolen tannophilus NRRL Y-2460]|uniref:DHHA2 domain-containing protein n=1 Tax=Pachysolen tannophilus NRRL Y-2460 TaxID=669874 RepID=A0A1E4TRY4_PACTA|nr:hypothetical protein PACTADRAFT_4437 [Pachysolen tannophilus NRRL Y-2460]
MLRSFANTFSKPLLNESNEIPVITLVSGNSSADLDSVIGSISYSFLYYNYWENPIYPFINILKKDLTLRKDIQYIFDEFHLDPENFLFVDDLIRAEKKNFDLILVDHNSLQYDKKIIEVTKFNVTGIIDHHFDEKLYLNANPRIIEKSGSCSSLILNYWYDLYASSNSKHTNMNEVFKSIAKFILPPILIDTACMTHKVEKSDLRAIEIIKNHLDSSSALNFQNYFQEIRSRKTDISGFSIYELLKKDYKEYEYNGHKVGISTIPDSIDYIFKQNSFGNESKFLTDFNKWSKERQLDLCVVMTNFVDKSTDKFTRELALSFVNKSLDASKIIDSLDKKLDLVEINNISIDDNSNIVVYEQRNIQHSRKQVAPFLQEIFQNSS